MLSTIGEHCLYMVKGERTWRYTPATTMPSVLFIVLHVVFSRIPNDTVDRNAQTYIAWTSAIYSSATELAAGLGADMSSQIESRTRCAVRMGLGKSWGSKSGCTVT